MWWAHSNWRGGRLAKKLAVDMYLARERERCWDLVACCKLPTVDCRLSGSGDFVFYNRIRAIGVLLILLSVFYFRIPRLTHRVFIYSAQVAATFLLFSHFIHFRGVTTRTQLIFPLCGTFLMRIHFHTEITFLSGQIFAQHFTNSFSLLQFEGHMINALEVFKRRKPSGYRKGFLHGRDAEFKLSNPTLN